LAIDVSWPKDSGAEEYVLMRAPDADIPMFSQVYRGTGLRYDDRSCEDQERYLYILWKVRGDEVFGPSNPVLGFASAVTKDEYEPNNAKVQATVLTFENNANVPYFQSEFGSISTDYDWYAVDVPGRMRAILQVTQTAPTPSEVGGELMTRLKYSVDEYLVERARQNGDIFLENTSVSAKRMYIQLYTTALEALDAPGEGGGIVISYKVKLVRIEAL
jgi:hypothetical protein